MENKEFALMLENRTLEFAVKTLKLCGKLPNSTEGNVVRNQLAKSGTSVGANYREANRARSKADFKNKIKICESESSETDYWLTIIKLMEWLPEVALVHEQKESKELLSIFSAIGQKLNTSR